VGHVAHEGEGEMDTEFWWGTREGENNLENLRVDVDYNMKVDIQEIDRMGVRIGLIVFRLGRSVGLF